jgi:hypothetical protein
VCVYEPRFISFIIFSYLALMLFKTRKKQKN